MNKEFFINNRKNIAEAMEEDSLLVLFSGEAPWKSADEYYQFTVNRNFYYMTGIDRPKFILLINKKGEKITESLYIDKVSEVEEKWTGKRLSEEEAKNISGITSIMPYNAFEGNLNGILYGYDYKSLYLDMERYNYTLPSFAVEEFSSAVTKKYPWLNIKNIHHAISSRRVIKSCEEIECIKKAIDITGEGIVNMMQNAKPGMMEYEIEAYFDFTLKKEGVKDFAFKTIAASGKNAAVLHYDKNNCKTEDGQLILFDLGAQYNYYNGDISRTFPVNGQFTDRQKEIYNIVLMAQQAVFDIIKPGLLFSELNKAVIKVYEKELKKINLIKEDNEVSKYYYHGVSHFLGLDTHDVSGRDSVLKAGMVFTVEPGLYIAEENIGIRIEDNVLVTEEGYEILSKNIIKSPEDIERLMENKN